MNHLEGRRKNDKGRDMYQLPFYTKTQTATEYKQLRLGILKKKKTNIPAGSAEICLVSCQVELTLTTVFKDALSSEGSGDFCLGSSRFM